MAVRREVKLVGRVDREDTAPAPTAAVAIFRAWCAQPRDAEMPGAELFQEFAVFPVTFRMRML